MADIKISQLGAAIAVGDTDLLPIVSGGNTLKATAAQVKEHSIGNTNISSIGDGSVTGAISALNTDKQPKTLATPLTIGGVSKTTVEDALGGLVSENQTLTNVIAPIEDGTNYSKTYTTGKQFYRNGNLYQVTASSVNTSTAINTGSGGNAAAVSDVVTQLYGITHQYLHGTSSVETGFTKTLESCYVINGVKYIQLRFQSTSGIIGRTKIANLETDLRPKSIVYFVCACASTYGNKLTTPVTGYIETNGNITVGDSLESTSTNVKDINIVLSYV